jgi:hypothetical protein
MIDAKLIPDEVVEAASVQLPGMAGHQRYVRAAIAAALAAWPGMSVAPIPRLRPYKAAETLQHIILPLQETPNAK